MREFINWLTEAAGNLPEGLDAPIDLTICDRTNKQFIDNVEVDLWVAVGLDGKFLPEGGRGVHIIGHWHPGESPGKVQRGIAADVDDELRELTDPGGGGLG